MDRATYQAPAHGWTCFHCGETFTNPGSARDHFGAAPTAEPGCMVRVALGSERGLLMALREAESRIERYMEEDSETQRAMRAMQSRHANQLRLAEEAGYERGLRDANAGPSFDLITHLNRQRAFSERTFGPGAHTAGVLDHIRKELVEIEAKPADLTEWIDVVLLALDGAWRAGHSPEAIVAALRVKQFDNEVRTWPDWRTVPEGKAIEHDRTGSEGDRYIGKSLADLEHEDHITPKEPT